MKRIVPFLVLIALGCSLCAQVDLLPPINGGGLPADPAPICSIPNQVPPIDSSGRPEEERAADFTAYDLSGDAFQLSDALALGKPILMIATSYTCPVFRNRIPSSADWNGRCLDHALSRTAAPSLLSRSTNGDRCSITSVISSKGLSKY